MKGGSIMGVGNGVLFVMLFMLYNLMKLLYEGKEWEESGVSGSGRRVLSEGRRERERER